MRVNSVKVKDPFRVIENACIGLRRGDLIMLPEDREQIGNIIEALIALLDAADGDPDLEADHDDEDSFDAELCADWQGEAEGVLP